MEDAFRAALRAVHRNPNVMPMPWERGPAATILSGGGIIPLQVENVTVNAPVPPVPQRIELPSDRSQATPAHMTETAQAFKLKSTSNRDSPAEEDSETRAGCLRSWLQVILQMKETFAVFSGIPWQQNEAVQVRTLADYVENKATGTLATRLHPWSLFFQWIEEHHYKAYDLDEPMAHEYISWMVSAGKPATRPSSFLGSIGFCIGSFGFGRGQLILMSSRVRGVSLRGLKTKRVTRKRDPLKMKWVQAIEKAVVETCWSQSTAVLSQQEAAIAGFIAMLVHTRSRNKDLSRVTKEPTLDLTEDGSAGYIETDTTGDATKSGNTAKKARLALPIVGLALGLSGEPWAEAWLQIRCLVGLDAAADGCLLREPLVGGTFSPARIESGQTSEWLKFLLNKLGVASDELLGVGSHSCKATLLSLLAKAGASPEDRKILGGHAQQGDRSMLEYSRDALAGPLDRLERTLELVRTNKFDPDATRSGRWKTGATSSTKPAGVNSELRLGLSEVSFGGGGVGEVVRCATCKKTLSDGITIVEKCEGCNSWVHAEPPCLGKCTACFQWYCAACRQGWTHSCIGFEAAESSDEMEERSSSTSDSAAIDQVAAVATSSKLSGSSATGACPKRMAKSQWEFPTEGAVISKRWRTVHRKSSEEGRTACGFPAPPATYETLVTYSLEGCELCERPGCFSQRA